MKIDRFKSKKCSSDVPFDCKVLINKLKSCNEDELLLTLKKIKTWGCGKCELYHWIDILDIFDAILEDCCRKKSSNQWILPVDIPENAKKKELLLSVISFTSLLIEHSFSRHLYNSIEHLITLLSSTDMQIVLAILNLLFVFSKRSNFFSRISSDKRQALLSRLCYLAENWGGKDYGFGLAECCQDLPLSSYPSSATTLNFEFYANERCNTKVVPNSFVGIHIENVHLIDKPLWTLMEEIVEKYQVPSESHIQLFTHLRLTKNFANYQNRLYCVQARLNALSIIVYCQSVALQEANTQLLYNGLIEELVDVLELKNPDLIEIKSASLKALTSIIHLDRNSKLKVIIDTTGASSYHGFLPILVRNCIHSLISGYTEQFPLNFATSLFSFLYHLASYESGCEALVQCGIMESLLKVISWKGPELDHITFVTRAVRVIDLITNLEMGAFQNNNGLNIFVQRLENEVDICRNEQPFEIEVPIDKVNKEKNNMALSVIEESEKNGDAEMPMEVENEVDQQQQQPEQPAQLQLQQPEPITIDKSLFSTDILCYPQRAALLKSMLNFLKKAVQYSTLSEGVRHLMYASFPRSIRHIISNAEYYGPSLFLLATDVVSVYVYHEPSLLSTLQDNGLTDVVLYALLVKDVPSTKEVLASLPNVFTALCLNRRGLEAFVELKPFERLFKIFLSPDYLQAMRRRRSESIGDTATSLGNAMDELMRHQPSLRVEAIKAIIKLLEEICKLGSDSKYVCSKTKSNDSIGLVLTEASERVIPTTSNISNDLSSSEEEEDFDDDTATTTPPSNVTSEIASLPPTVATTSASREETSAAGTSKQQQPQQLVNRSNEQRQQIPLHDYIFNVMRFVDAILSNNSTDDHCQEFLRNNGLEPLFKILKLPNLPPDFPSSPACYNVASVFKSLLNLTHEKTIFSSCLGKLKEIIEKLDPLFGGLKPFDGSVLLEDLIQSLSSKKSASSPYFVSPILQSMSAVHAYIIMFVHICRTGQGDIRAISIEQWGSPLGIDIISQLSRIYISLVWESTLLLGLNDSNSQKYEFVKAQLEKLNSLLKGSCENESVASPMEVDSDNNDPVCSSCGNRSENEKKSKSGPVAFSKNTQQKYIKPLLTVASKLGRSLAELFGLLVKLCVGSPIRRRSHHTAPSQLQPPSQQSQNISKYLNILLFNGLSWQPPYDSTNIPKYRLTFYVCSIGFSSPMLFDDRKFPYHLMLQNFVLNGGHDSFFNCFSMAVGQNADLLTKGSELPDGIIEFLDSWLLLLEKMANPQTLLDSPHSLPAKADARNTTYVPFDPVQYLIRTHKKTFACITELWNDNLFQLSNESIINSMLTILSHLLKGESIIEKYIKNKEATTSNVANTSATSSAQKPTAADAPPVSNAQVTTSSANVDPASTVVAPPALQPPRSTTNPDPAPPAAVEDSSAHSQFLDILVDMGFTREMAGDALSHTAYNVEQAAEWLLAHANLSRPPNAPTPAPTAEFDMTEEDQVIRAIAMSLDDSSKQSDKYAEQLKQITHIVPPLMNEVPLNKSELDSFTNSILSGTLKLLDQLPETVYKCCELLIAVAKRNGNLWFQEMVTELIKEITDNINSLIHSTSFIEDKNEKSSNDWANQLSTLPEAHKLSFRIHLLALLFNEMKNGCAQQISNSDLFSNVVELLERSSYLMTLVYEKESKITTPKWLCPLILLIDVYEKYALALRRRKQLLSNNCKRQWKFFDDRTSRWTSYVPVNNKPIDEAFRNGEQFYRFTAVRRRYTIQFNNMLQVNEETGSWRPIMFVNGESGDPVEQSSAIEWAHIESLTEKLSKSLIETMVSLVKLPIDPDTLHAVLRLCLRLTRDYENACLFAELGGISTLLNLTKDSQFVGIVSMTTLIIRHVVEDKNVLKVLMEKIIRFQANSSLINNREMHYIFRYFNPAACREIELFKESAKSILRVNVFNKKLDEEDDRTSTFLRAIPLKLGENPDGTIELPKITRDVICELLDLLPIKHAEEIKTPEDDAEKCGESKPKVYIFNASSILALLAELVRSYNVVAKIVCEHQYTRGYTDSVPEDCSTLSFILDNLLYLSTIHPLHSDKDYPSFCKILFASLASVTYTGEIHQTIVSEIKSSLNRTISYPETAEKHLKIQAISSLITLVVESCPNSSFNPFHGRSGTTLGNNSSVLKLMAKRGLITDLAKVIQSLDLSSPNMSATVNSLLKTLEFLSKTLNYPSNVYGNRLNRSRADVASANASLEAAAANEQIMEEDTVANDSTNSNVDNSRAVIQSDTSSSQPASAVVDDMNTTTAMSIGAPQSNANADEIGDNDLFGLDGSYDYNSHPRSATFNSDDLRTDDDDDDVMQRNVVAHHGDLVVNNRSELHDNTVNSNCAESESSDETQSEDDDEDDDDVEDEEEDAAGSAQDEHEEEGEEDEDEQMEEDDDEDVDDYLQDILDEGFRNYESNLLFNMEDMFPSFLVRHNDRYNFSPFGNNEDTSLNNDNPTQVVISTPDVLVQHPLLSNNIEIAANASQLYSINHASTSNAILNSRHSRSGRSRTFRTSVISSNSQNWHMNPTRSNTSVILHRLLGSSYFPPEFYNGISSPRGNNLIAGNLDIPEEELYNSSSGNGYSSAYSAGMNQNSSLNGIPSTMCRWYEECRVLDGEYMYDAIFLVKGEIMKFLEKFKEEDLKEKDKKKNDDVKITSLIKELKSHRDEADRSVDVHEEEQRIEDLHAHIEELANSVINQVLEPPAPTSRLSTRRPDVFSLVSQPNTVSAAALSAAEETEAAVAVAADNLTESDRIEMEVNDETAVVPMATDDQRTEPESGGSAPPISDEYNPALSSQMNSEGAPEMMDQSPSASNERRETLAQLILGDDEDGASHHQASSTRVTYNLTPEERAILGDQEIPEGVDPSFLAALPENIRQEVIAEQFRLQRLNNMQQQQQQLSTANSGTNNSSTSVSFAEVNPEFLAALPPSIQEEVLAQQRAEQQRLAAQSANPDVPVDPDSFFRSLPPSLRRQVLSDLDDSQIRLLSVDIANEARALRQENEIRQRQFQERLFSSSTALSRIIRSATSARARYAIGLPNHWSFNYSSNSRLGAGTGGGGGGSVGGSGHSAGHYNRNTFSSVRFPRNSLIQRSIKGKLLLDFDSLSSLLILLFIHDNLVNSQRLHRLIRNLCFHAPTRQWVIQSLLEIMERTKESADKNMDYSNAFSDPLSGDDLPNKFSVQNPCVSWLSISLESAFGSKTHVFYVQNSNNKTQPSHWKRSPNYSIFIHPQASSFVCRNVLDILIFLSKTFPDQFISCNTSKNQLQSSSSLNTSSSGIKSDSQETTASSKSVPNFFDVLMRHDSIHANKKKTSKHSSNATNVVQQIDSDGVKQAEQSPFSQLLSLLSHQFIKKSSMLTDRLIRLLTHVTYAMYTDLESRSQNAATNEAKEHKYAELEKSLANERLLKLVVDVLISKSCSEEGLVDSTSLLIKLSTVFPSCRAIFYKLLLEGVRSLGENVFADVNALSFELGELLSKIKKENSSIESIGEQSSEKLNANKGTLQDRYSNMSIVVSAAPTAKPSISGKEVQLPSMSTLISKSSSQFLFLRILKIIMHIREIAQNKSKASSATNAANNETNMDVDKEEDKLSSELQLDSLWDKLSDCLCILSEAPDDHAVLVLQPTVESFFLVHAPEKASKADVSRSEPASSQLAHINQSMAISDSFPSDTTQQQHPDGENVQIGNLPPDTQKFLYFAEKHSKCLNQILRQSSVHLANGPFAVLVDHTRILDFDVKRRYFRQELERLDHGVRRDDLAVHIRRENVFEDSFRELNRRTPEEWKNRFYVVFEGEEGQDAGGLLREWFAIISREIFNPNYALFTTSPGDRVTYMINQSSYCNTNHLSYFKFVGRLIGKAIFDNKLLDCYFTRSFYKHILGKVVKYTDLEAQDNALYKGLVYLLEHNVADMGTEMRFVYEVDDFGVVKTIELVPDGRNIVVTEANKHDYVKLMCQAKMTNSIRAQLTAFLEGFYALVPKKLISIFNEHELELLISGLPNIDIDDLKSNTEYHKYQAHSLQIQWFWRALRTFDQADRAKFLQFVTGTSKVPLQGFSALEGMNGPQKFQIHLDDRSTDRLPSAHTCFNQLDLPAYETYDKLRLMLLKAIHECSEGFGFA